MTTAQAEAEGLRVFVAGIPWKIDEEVLKRDFEECGTVEDIFILKDHEGNSKGRAFITFRDSAAVEAALKFDNTPYGGRTIFVKVADEKKKGTSAGKDDAAKGPVASKVEIQSKAPLREAVKTADRDFPTDKPAGCVSLCLKNIGDATQADVRTFLKDCTVQSVRIVTDRKTGMARGIAFVDFPATEEVDKAMARNGKKLNGLAVDMSFEAPRQRPRPEGCMSVAVKKLGPHTTENQIRKLFRGLESLSEVRVICDRERQCTGLAFAEFTEAADVEAAVRRDGMSVRGNTVFICYETKAKKERPAAAGGGGEKKRDRPQAAQEGGAKKHEEPARKKGKKGKEQPGGLEGGGDGADIPLAAKKGKTPKAAPAEESAEKLEKRRAREKRKRELRKKRKREAAAEDAAEEAPEVVDPGRSLHDVADDGKTPGKKKKRRKAAGDGEPDAA